jgi:plastocyanin
MSASRGLGKGTPRRTWSPPPPRLVSRMLSAALLASAFTVSACTAAPAPTPVRPVPDIELTAAVMSMENFQFRPDVLRTRVGVPIALRLTNPTTTAHDLTMKGSSPVHIFVLPAQRIHTSVTLVKPGTYTFFCSVAAHAGYGMKGRIIAEP